MESNGQINEYQWLLPIQTFQLMNGLIVTNGYQVEIGICV